MEDKSRTRKTLKIIGGIFAGIVFVGLLGLFYATRGLEEGQQVTIEAVDIAGMEDGTYVGEYNHGRWSNEVEVSIKDGEVTEIRMLDGFSQGDVAEKIYKRIIEEQEVDVDAVTGATVSSNAYKKAVENALKGE